MGNKSLTRRGDSWLAAALIGIACAPAGETASPPLSPPERPIDAGIDAGCGPSFDEALEEHAPERVCQTTVYDRVTGYCTFWQPCSALTD